jgi:hypothetical protein
MMEITFFNKTPIKSLFVAIFLLITSGAGCAKNVDRINFTKWGSSFVPRGSGMDTTAQGGGALNGVVPQSADKRMPKASVGGTYLRSFAESPRYRMVGGFHVNPAQK